MRTVTAAALARRSAGLGLALALVVSGCRGSAPPPGALRTSGCPRCGPVARVGALPRGDLDECSGVVAGGAHPDALYLHNDSGDGPRFFAVGGDGALRGELQVPGATAVDWEDAARGPCGAGGGSCLFFGDIGDNDRERRGYAIYEVKEPDALGGAPRALAARAIPFAYPDGSHNAETLLVHPVTGAITLVTKVKGKKKGAAGVYELPSRPAADAGTATLVRAGSIEAPTGSPRFTGGDVHPAGAGVLLRTYTHVFFYPMTQDQTVAQALAGAPCELPAAEEDQGEAIAWVPGGWDYVTIGEGAEAPVHRVSCEAP
ncbi:hypothetical protein [Sorangium sp. So ce1335]|uniref:hypothetical protein n=1 Tax=Sorangium sp. So ce1335 TaxID=3133335 RepID=UPI003F61D53E